MAKAKLIGMALFHEPHHPTPAPPLKGAGIRAGSVTKIK